MAIDRSLLQQDRGWGLFCQMSVAPLIVGTLEWLIAVGACWFIGASYAAPWTWLAHLAAAPTPGRRRGHRTAGAFTCLGGMGVPAHRYGVRSTDSLPVVRADHRAGRGAAPLGRVGRALWFILQIDHISGLIGLVGLLLLLI